MRSPRTLIIGFLCMAAYWMLAIFFTPGSLFQVINVIVGGMAVGVIIAFTPGWSKAVVARRPVRGQHLVLGIGLAWTSDIVLRTYAGVYRVMGSPHWVLDHPVLGHIPGFGLWIAIFAALLHMTVPDPDDNRIPSRQFVILGFVVAILTIVIAMMALSAVISPDNPFRDLPASWR